LPLRASEILRFKVLTTQNMEKMARCACHGVWALAQNPGFSTPTTKNRRSCQNDAARTQYLPFWAATENIPIYIPILREKLTNLQYQYLESSKTILLPTLKTSDSNWVVEAFMPAVFVCLR
jgi:hypothetical protein